MRNIRLPELRNKTGLSRPTIYRLIQQGKFPPPGKAGCSSVWLEEDIDTWVSACHTGRGQVLGERLGGR